MSSPRTGHQLGTTMPCAVTFLLYPGEFRSALRGQLSSSPLTSLTTAGGQSTPEEVHSGWLLCKLPHISLPTHLPHNAEGAPLGGEAIGESSCSFPLKSFFWDCQQRCPICMLFLWCGHLIMGTRLRAPHSVHKGQWITIEQLQFSIATDLGWIWMSDIEMKKKYRGEWLIKTKWDVQSPSALSN